MFTVSTTDLMDEMALSALCTLTRPSRRRPFDALPIKITLARASQNKRPPRPSSDFARPRPPRSMINNQKRIQYVFRFTLSKIGFFLLETDKLYFK